MSRDFPTLPPGGDLERGAVLAPRFDANGLVAAVAEMMAVSTILDRAYELRVLKRFKVDAAGGGLTGLTEV